MKNYIAEAIGTFAIVFCGAGSIVVDNTTSGALGTLGIAIAFGVVVMAMIMIFARTSGAHFNPAVSITLAVFKKFEWKQVGPYVFAQVMGAVVGSLVLAFLFPADELLGTTLPSGSAAQAWILEFIITFFLVLTILFVGDAPNLIHAAATIGAVVLLGALFAGPMCGASMNPARSIGPAIVSGHLEYLWIYVTAPVSGGIVAGIVEKKMKH